MNDLVQSIAGNLQAAGSGSYFRSKNDLNRNINVNIDDDDKDKKDKHWVAALKPRRWALCNGLEINNYAPEASVKGWYFRLHDGDDDKGVLLSSCDVK